MIWLLRKTVFLCSESSALQMSPEKPPLAGALGMAPHGLAEEMNSLETNCTGILMLSVL